MIAALVAHERLWSSGGGIPVAVPVAVPVGLPATTNTADVSAPVLPGMRANRDGTPPAFRDHLTRTEAHHD